MLCSTPLGNTNHMPIQVLHCLVISKQRLK